MKKKINVRVDEKLYNQVKELAEIEGLTTTGFLGIIIRKGITGFKETGIQPTQNEEKAPKIDVENLIFEAEEAAKIGSDELEDWLSTISPQEENALKYKIKKMRATAKNADFEKELERLPELAKEGDNLSLQGRAIFLPWWDELSKEIRFKLEHTHYAKWRFDSGKADSHIRSGVKPLGYSTHHIHMQQQGKSVDSVDDDNAQFMREMEADLERNKKGTLIE